MKSKKIILIISVVLIVVALSLLSVMIIKDRNRTHDGDNICDMGEKC